MIPISTKMRPTKLDEFVGQEHFFYKGSLFYNSILNKTFNSAIFYGPPGVGKTTLARIIAREMDADFIEVNASTTGTKELKEVIENAKVKFFGLQKANTYLYVDEFHRWNKSQQDALLKALEEGTIKFIASTTENPYYSINNAILSRVRAIYEFKRLSSENLYGILSKTLEDKKKGFGNLNILYDKDAIKFLANESSGDARIALDALGFIIDNLSETKKLNVEIVKEALQQRVSYYDKDQDKYDLLSALQKSIRGSDPNATILYLCKLFKGGADIQMIGRRLMVIAAEDIGLAYPQAISIVTSCITAANMIGYPEAEIPLSEAAVLLASSPKSNSAYKALKEAKQTINSFDDLDIPIHIKDKNYTSKENKAAVYKYPHAYGGYVKQQYLPDSLYKKDIKFYNPTNNGVEASFKKYLEAIEKIDEGNN